MTKSIIRRLAYISIVAISLFSLMLLGVMPVQEWFEVRDTKDELLDGDNKYTIEKTGERVDAKKQILFWSLPDVLIITIKRFSNSLEKNNALVEIPLADFDLSKHVIGYDNKSYVYDLYGICNHIGGVMGGHYTANIKTNNGWYHFNDRNVTKIADESKIISPMAYCLFFRKKK